MDLPAACHDEPEVVAFEQDRVLPAEFGEVEQNRAAQHPANDHDLGVTGQLFAGAGGFLDDLGHGAGSCLQRRFGQGSVSDCLNGISVGSCGPLWRFRQPSDVHDPVSRLSALRAAAGSGQSCDVGFLQKRPLRFDNILKRKGAVEQRPDLAGFNQ